jgi:hypothetical protein
MLCMFVLLGTVEGACIACCPRATECMGKVPFTSFISFLSAFSPANTGVGVNDVNDGERYGGLPVEAAFLGRGTM